MIFLELRDWKADDMEIFLPERLSPEGKLTEMDREKLREVYLG